MRRVKIGELGMPEVKHFRRKAEQGISLQGGFEALRKAEQDRKTNCHVPATTMKQQFDRLDEEWRKLETASQELRAVRRQQEAFMQELEAKGQACVAKLKGLADERRQQARLMREYTMSAGRGKAAIRLEALQKDGRQRALDHVGISRSAADKDGKPWGERFTHLVQDWTSTCQTVLSESQNEAISERFGSHFMSFLGEDALVMLQPDPSRPPHTLRLGMPWAERSFIMDFIDDLQPESVREGGRIAYMAFFGCECWEDELKRVNAGMLAHAA